MLKQRCETCGQDWWDSHVCQLKLTAAPPMMLGKRIDFPSLEARADWLKANMSRPVDACACIGPQNGQPLCPCAMRGIVVKNGRYVRPEQDLGPVPTTPQEPK